MIKDNVISLDEYRRIKALHDITAFLDNCVWVEEAAEIPEEAWATLAKEDRDNM